MKPISIQQQAINELKKIFVIGKPKLDKQDGLIHSIGTMRTYTKHCVAFAKYCRAEFGCRRIEDCKTYVKQFCEREKYSPWVRKVQLSALAKLYHCKASDFGTVDTGKRSRATVLRSRHDVVRDRHFSESGKYKDYVAFARSTGLRKVEMEHLTGSDFYEKDGKAFLHVHRHTKGGRIREVPVIGAVGLVRDVCRVAGDKKVIEVLCGRLRAPNGSDTHSYRRDYVKALYDSLKRPVEEIPQAERYYCRADKKGDVYDRKAMAAVSNAVGHTRISIISQSYLD